MIPEIVLEELALAQNLNLKNIDLSFTNLNRAIVDNVVLSKRREKLEKELHESIMSIEDAKNMTTPAERMKQYSPTKDINLKKKNIKKARKDKIISPPGVSFDLQ